MKFPITRVRLPFLIAGTILFATFLLLIFGLAFSRVRATEDAATNSTHFITIFDGANQTTLRSDAETVRDVLERAEISYSDDDTIEPALDDTIDSDYFNINIYRARDVVVIDGQSEVFVRTAATDAESVARAAGVELLTADIVEVVPYNRFLETGMASAYQVKRAKDVHLDFNGKLSDVRTQAATVGGFLAEQGIDSDPDKVWVSLGLDATLTDGAKLSIFFQGKHTITLEEEIPFSEQVTYDFALDYGQRIVTQEGKVGKRYVVYDVDMRDGEVLSREFVSEAIVETPIEQHVTVGQKVNLPAGSHTDWMSAAGISSADYGYVDFIISHESGWRPNAVSSNGYYGLYQTSQTRLVNACGSNWASDPICQLRSATSYATGRYGSWSGAYQFWTTHHWW